MNGGGFQAIAHEHHGRRQAERSWPRAAPEQRGTGLGLAISRAIVEQHGGRAIVEQHGGRIGVESTEGRGSRFSFEIPFAESASTRPTIPASPA